MKSPLTAVVIVLCTALTTVPLLAVPAPPLSDLPSTAGRIWLEWRLWEGSVPEAGQFHFAWPPPYALQDALTLLVCKISNVSPARILMELDTIVWMILLFALVRLGRRLSECADSGIWVIPILASLFRWDFAGQFGNFAWRMAETELILFYVLLVLESGPRSPAAAAFGRAIGFLAAPLILYFTHAIAYAFWILIAAASCRSLISARLAMPAAAGCLIPAGYHLLRTWKFSGSMNSLSPILADPAADPYRWIPVSWNKLSLFGGIYPDPILQGSIFLALAIAVFAAGSRALAGPAKPDPVRRHLMIAGVVAASAFLLPYATRWPAASRTLYLHFSNVRALELAALLAAPFAVFVLPEQSVIRRRLILPGLLLIVLVTQTVRVHRYFEWSHDLQRIVFGEWDPGRLSGRRFYSAVFPSMSGYPALHRYPHYASARGAYDPRLFIEEHFWVRPKSPWPVLSIYETQIDAYRQPAFSNFYDDILIVTSPDDPFIAEYSAFWKTAHPDGGVTAFSPFAHLFSRAK